MPFNLIGVNRVVQLANDDDMKIKWRYFLKSIKNESLNFAVVINEIQSFLEPVYNAMVSETELQKIWDRGKKFGSKTKKG